MPASVPLSDPNSQTILISVNPKAGRTSPMERATRLAGLLRKRDFQVELLTDLDQVSARANELYGVNRLRALVGVGGDGTAAELVNRTVPGVPITLLAAGTANLLAKQFRLPLSPGKMADVLVSGTVVTLDAGLANGRLFLAMISAGLDADIVRQVHSTRENRYRKDARKGAHISYLSYIKPVFHSIFSYSYPAMELTVQGESATESKSVSGRWVFLFNLPRYGWGVSFTPKCLGNDGLLNYCVFRHGGFICSFLNACWAQLGCLHRFLPGTRLGTGAQFTLSAAEPVPYQLDGDPAGLLPVEVRIIPNRFTTLLPSRVAEQFAKRSRHDGRRSTEL